MAMTLLALDLSHWDSGPGGGDIDFQAIANFGIVGVILKATQGVGMTDPTYALRVQAARQVGLKVGAYHFNTGDTAQSQVDHFFSVAKPQDDMLCALDFEDNRESEMSLALAREFLELADGALGRRFWFYSGNRIKESIVLADNETKQFFALHKLWGAQYGPQFIMLDSNGSPLPWDKVTLWQFSGDGVNSGGVSIPGIDRRDAGRVDLNAYDGTGDGLRSEWAGSPLGSGAAATS